MVLFEAVAFLILAVKPYLLTCHFLLLGLASAQTVTLTSSVEQDGRQVVCPGVVVNFTCMVNEASRLRWIAEPLQSDPIDFISAATAGAMAVDDSGQFRAVLVSIVHTEGGSSDFNSRLTVTASGSGSLEVQCSGRQDTSPTIIMMSKTLIIAGTYTALYRKYYAKKIN